MTLTEEERKLREDAAVEAQNELVDIPDDALVLVANWVARWRFKAGYRRLGKILVEHATEENKKS